MKLEFLLPYIKLYQSNHREIETILLSTLGTHYTYNYIYINIYIYLKRVLFFPNDWLSYLRDLLCNNKTMFDDANTRLPHRLLCGIQVPIRAS